MFGSPGTRAGPRRLIRRENYNFSLGHAAGKTSTELALLPPANAQYSLGNSTRGWASARLSTGGSVFFGGTGAPYVYGTDSTGDISLNGSLNGEAKLSANGTTLAVGGAIRTCNVRYLSLMDGVIPAVQFATLLVNRSLTSTTSDQQIFPNANDTLTVEAATTYFFDALLHVSGMSGTSGNMSFSIVGAGTATFTDAKWQAVGHDATTLSTAAAQGGSFVTSATGTGNLVSAATGTAVAVSIRGIFRTNAEGTIIPSIGLTTAAAATMESESYFRCWRAADNSTAATSIWA